jgi:hypothetical protein
MNKELDEQANIQIDKQTGREMNIKLLNRHIKEWLEGLETDR